MDGLHKKHFEEKVVEEHFLKDFIKKKFKTAINWQQFGLPGYKNITSTP